MEKRTAPDPRSLRTLSAEELRAVLLVDRLFAADEVRLVLTDLDRAVVGGAEPRRKTLALTGSEALRSESFCERRELGVLNVGGAGKVRVDDATFPVQPRDLVYVGRGSRVVELASDSPSAPARFYLLSYPAHADFPTTCVREAQAEKAELGSAERANRRVIARYVHPGGARSCQLVMGVTTLLPGSVWNTMPPHTHDRRTEIYFYFDLPADARVFHLAGSPAETRHLLVANEEAVLSPAWSIHSGCGTAAYRFCWGMGGENQTFSDMDDVAATALR